MKHKFIGIVVIGRNEGLRLQRCLRSLTDYSENLVYVDSGSTDDSVEAARNAGAVVVELDISVPFTAARARNAGYGELRRHNQNIQLVQFVDGDCELAPGWIDTATQFLRRNHDVAVVCGRRREQYRNASVYNRLCDREWDTPVGEVSACGGDSVIRCEAFEQVGCFNGSLICGEEPELCIRLKDAGWRIWRLDAEMTLHDAAMTRFSQWWRRSVRSGFGFAQVSRLHANSPHALWKRQTFSAVVWGGLIPLAIALGATYTPLALVMIAAYLMQIVRIAQRESRAGRPDAWVYAGFSVLEKFPQCLGVLTYYFHRLRGKKSTIIEYKTS